MPSRVDIVTFESQVLKDNPLGDPNIRRVPVYLPDGYDGTETRYPVVFMLTGFTGRGLMYLNDDPLGENLIQRLDRLMGAGTIRPMIVVMPDCITKYGGSQYLNSSATGRYEDHVIQELVPYVDAQFRTRGTPETRAVMGKSSGGYGTLILGMHNPEVFRLMACHSGDTYFEYCYKQDFIGYLKGIMHQGPLDKWLATFRTTFPRGPEFHGILNTVAMASCYSPNPASPHGFDLPFDEQTGEIRDDVWARWLQWDPVYRMQHHVEALRQMRLIFLDCGLRDEFNIQFGTRIFAQRLRNHSIPFIHEEFEDGHMNIQYRYDVSLQAISNALP